MVPELDTRFTMAQVEEILGAILKSFPKATEKAGQIYSSGVNEEQPE